VNIFLEHLEREQGREPWQVEQARAAIGILYRDLLNVELPGLEAGGGEIIKDGGWRIESGRRKAEEGWKDERSRTLNIELSTWKGGGGEILHVVQNDRKGGRWGRSGSGEREIWPQRGAKCTGRKNEERD